MLRPGIALVAIVVATGCDPKVDSDYKGEVLTSLRGAVVGEPAPSPDMDQFEVHVDWFWYEATDDPSGTSDELQLVEVTAEFPFGFRLDFFEPPAVLHDVGGIQMNLAEMYILSAPYPSPEVGGRVPFYAMADRHVLVYLESDVPPGSLAAAFLGGPLPAGFHLMEATQRADCSTSISPWDCENFGQDDLTVATDDLDTLIPLLHVDPADGLGGILPAPWLTLEELRAQEG
jgi:hypothetical protein